MSRFNKIKNWLKQTSKEVFFKTYPFDGYDPITHSFIDSHGHLTSGLPPVSFNLIFATFLGLPTRLETPRKLTFRRLVKNLFGGQFHIRTNTVFDTLISIIIIICKAVFIFPLKLITQPFKLFINIIKLLTEFIPLGFSHIFEAIGATIIQKAATIKDDVSFNRVAFWKGFILVPILFILSCVSFLISVSFTSIYTIGRTLTSPLISARLAFNYGRSLDSGKYSWRRPLSYVMGFIFALFSLAITALLWLIFLPLFISALIYYIPTLGQALTWFAHLPMINSAIGYIQMAINQIPSVATFISTLTTETGITFISAVLYLRTPLGVVIGTLCSFVADTFSNWWVTSFRKQRISSPIQPQPLSLEDITIDSMASASDEVLDRLSEQVYGYVALWIAINPGETQTLRIQAGNRELTIRIDPLDPLDLNQIREVFQRLRTDSANTNAPLTHSQRVLNLLRRRNEGEYDAEAAVFLVHQRANSAQNGAQRTLSSFQSPVLPYESTPLSQESDAPSLKDQSATPYCLPEGAPQYQMPPPTERTADPNSTPLTFVDPSPVLYQSYNPGSESP